MTMTDPTIADAAGRAARFTDYGVPDAGIRALFTTERLWQSWLDVEAALAGAEAELGIIPPAAAATIAEAAHLERLDLDRVRSEMARQSHPLVPLISELVRAAGEEAGGYVHWGATSQNVMQSGTATLLVRAHGILLGLLDDVLRALAARADETAETLMPGRTHGQHAVPMTFGFKVAGWVDELLRGRERLELAVRDLATAMVGGAIGNFASLGEAGPEVQRRVAARLGLEPMQVPSRAILDPQVAYLAQLALLSAGGARIATDVATLMQTEFGEVSEPVPPGAVGSSTMPHKRNPKLCYDIVDLSSDIRGALPGALEALIRPHEADGGATAIVAERLERAVVASGDLLVRLRMVADGLEVFPERMREDFARDGRLISSEAVMLALGEAIGREHAHEIVYEDAMRVARTGEDFFEVLHGDERVRSRIDDDRLHALLDPANHVGLSAEIAREAARRVRSTVR